MTDGRRVMLGVLGGSVPLWIGLTVFDPAVAHWAPAIVVGYIVRNIAMMAIGGVIGFAYDTETDSKKLLQLGAAAPALVATFLGANNARIDAQAHGEASIVSIVQPVYAEQQTQQFYRPNETGVQQFVRGVLGFRNEPADCILEVAEARDYNTARMAYQHVRAMWPAYPFALYEPSAGVPVWVVTLGGQMTAVEAVTWKAKLSTIPGLSLFIKKLP